MGYRREFEGIGNHACDFESTYLSVDKWTKRPDDLKGNALTIDGLLPREVRLDRELCVESGKEYSLVKGEKCPYNDESGKICKPPKFRFRITVEIEKVAG